MLDLIAFFTTITSGLFSACAVRRPAALGDVDMPSITVNQVDQRLPLTSNEKWLMTLSPRRYCTPLSITC